MKTIHFRILSYWPAQRLGPTFVSKLAPETLNRSAMRFHSNYHSTLLINFSYRSIYNDNMATRAPSQVRLIFYCLPAIDRVIRIKFTSCFRLTLPLLNPKTLHSRGRFILGASWPVTHPNILMIKRCGGQRTVQLQLCSIWTAREIELYGGL